LMFMDLRPLIDRLGASAPDNDLEGATEAA